MEHPFRMTIRPLIPLDRWKTDLKDEPFRLAMLKLTVDNADIVIQMRAERILLTATLEVEKIEQTSNICLSLPGKYRQQKEMESGQPKRLSI